VRSAGNDKETHEALVHPAMFAHPNPQHVAIIGGREGGALREVLKHKTVESALFLEQDEELVNIVRTYFPSMSNCSDLVGRATDCFKDDVVTVAHEDPQAFFKANYGSSAASEAGLLDVIIVDEKDPRHFPEFYNNQAFVSSLVKALSPEGVMVINAGMAPDIDDPRADMGVYFVREQLMQQLESHPNVEAMLVYEEARAGYNDPCAFLVVCKSATCRSRWYARSDQVDFAIYERIVRTNSKQRALSYYDGTTQFSYSLPPKAWETVYCRREPTPFECAYLHLDPTKQLHDLDVVEPSKSSFRLESSEPKSEEEEAETYVFATVDILKGSYIMPKHLASSLVLTERNLEGLQGNLNVGGGPVSVIEDLLEYIKEHGHESHTKGTAVHYVEIGGSVLIRKVDTPEEANVGRWVPPHPSGRIPVYSPVYERHRMSFDVFLVATENIEAGTELLRYKGLWAE
jgi:Spermine/spermidine synthase domain